MKILTGARCGYFIHCGDVGGTDILDLLAGLESAFVFGNTDYERDEMERYATSIGVRCLKGGGVVEIGGEKISGDAWG